MRHLLARLALRFCGVPTYLRVLAEHLAETHTWPPAVKAGCLYTLRPERGEQPVCQLGEHLYEVEGVAVRMRRARDVSEES